MSNQAANKPRECVDTFWSPDGERFFCNAGPICGGTFSLHSRVGEAGEFISLRAGRVYQYLTASGAIELAIALLRVAEEHRVAVATLAAHIGASA